MVAQGPEGPEVVMNATNAIRGYDPKDGASLWEVRGNSKITVSSPATKDGLIVATGGYQTPAPIYVVRAGSRGDLTPGAEEGSPEGLLWSTQKGGVYRRRCSMGNTSTC